MPQIVSIHSFRGGTGKSNFTANLGVWLAHQGKQVGIIDTDIQSPGIHNLFSLEEADTDYRLNDYLWEACPIAAAVHEVTPPEVAAGGGKVWLLPSSMQSYKITRILRQGYDVTRLTEGVLQLVESMAPDYLLIDTHPGLNEETLNSLTIADVLLILLRPDQQDFLGTAVTVDVARKLAVPKTWLVLNQVNQQLDQAMLSEKVQSVYDVPLIATLPFCDGLLELGSQGIFGLQQGDHPFSQGVKAIADHLIQMNPMNSFSSQE